MLLRAGVEGEEWLQKDTKELFVVMEMINILIKVWLNGYIHLSKLIELHT